MFVSGVLMIVLGLAMVVGGIVIPVDAAKPGLIVGGLAVGLAGLLNAYLGAPSRKEKAPAGMQPAKATILDAAVLPGSVAGYQMVELTLELHPKDGAPTQVKRKFSAGRLGRIEQGRELDVFYDPLDPRKVELA
ncbi:MAG TPA: hypothetical protein VGV34_08255 [Solirubrobacterales bacterium]|nr:hypothetical protein [Solirubrobacterales bacterium]